MCLITTCVSNFTIYDNFNKTFLFEALLHYCLNTKIYKMLLLQCNNFSTITYIFLDTNWPWVWIFLFSFNFQFRHSNVPFSHWFWAIGLAEESWSVTSIMSSNMCCRRKIIAVIVEEPVAWRTSSARTPRTTSFH